jgi:hypothetical protein
VNEAKRAAAITLRSAVPTAPGDLFTDREAGLLDEWLGRIQSGQR